MRSGPEPMLNNETGRKGVVESFEGCDSVLVNSHIRRKEVGVLVIQTKQRAVPEGLRRAQHGCSHIWPIAFSISENRLRTWPSA